MLAMNVMFRSTETDTTALEATKQEVKLQPPPA
jgi:hypothetical protein